MASPTIRNSVAPVSGLSATSPSDTAVGDMVVVVNWEVVSADSPPTHTLQSGFVAIVTQALTEVGGSGRASIAYKIATDAGAQSYQAYTSDVGTVTRTGLIVYTAGTFSTTGIISASTSTTNTTNPNPPQVTGLDSATEYCITCYGFWRPSASTTNDAGTPLNYTDIWETTTAQSAHLAARHRDLTGVTSEDPAAITDTFAPTGTCAITIALPEVSDQSLAGTLFTKAPTFFTGTVSTSYSLAGTLYQNSPTFFAGTVSLAGGAQNLTGALFTKVPTFFAGAVTHRLVGTVAGYLRLTGASGSRASTPDHASLDITGDIDIRADAVANDWAPGVTRNLVSKLGLSTGYRMGVVGGGFLDLLWYSAAGSVNKISTAVIPAADGERIQLRATIDVDNGAGGNDVKFYTRTDTSLVLTDNSGWTQLGTTVTFAAITDILAGSDVLSLGTSPDGTGQRFIGQIYQAAVLNGIDGTVVASPDFRDWDQRTSDTTLVDSQSKTWTISSPAVWHLPYFKAPTFFTGALSASYSLTGTLFQKAPTFFTGAVSLAAGPQTVSGVLYQNTPTFFTGTLASTYALTGTLYQNTPTFFTGAVSATYALTGTLYQNTPTFPQGSVTTAAGPQTVSGVLYQNTPVFFTGTLAATYALTGTLYQNTPTFFAGAITATVTLNGVLFQKAPTFPQGSVTTAAGPQTISGVLFTKAPTFFVGAVLAHQTITGTLFQKVPTFFAGSVTSVYPLTGALYQNTPVFFAGSIIADQALTGVLYQNTPVFFQGVFAPAGSLFGNLYQNTPVFFVGTMGYTGGSFWLVNPAGYTLNPAAYTVNGAAYDPILGGELPPWAIEVDGEIFVLDPLFFAGSVS